MTNFNKQTVFIAGGDGLLGRHLLTCIDKSRYHVIVLSRNRIKSNMEGVEYVTWDTITGKIHSTAKPDHIINLAGAGIADKRWTGKRKKELISSRVNSAQTIQTFLETNNIKPQSYISASAVGYYGDRGQEILTETSNPGDEFMSECCMSWEQAALCAGKSCGRTTIIRIGIVLTTKGGALPKMLMTKNMGIYNYFGKGLQYYPWIHINDLCRIIVEAMHNPGMEGIYNAVAPQEISNKTMMQEIMHEAQLKGILFSIPKCILELILGEMSHVVLDSNRVSGDKILNTGFSFEFKKVGKAVSHLIKDNI